MNGSEPTHLLRMMYNRMAEAHVGLLTMCKAEVIALRHSQQGPMPEKRCYQVRKEVPNASSLQQSRPCCNAEVASSSLAHNLVRSLQKVLVQKHGLIQYVPHLRSVRIHVIKLIDIYPLNPARNLVHRDVGVRTVA